MTEKSGRGRPGQKVAAQRVPIERQIDLRFPNFEGLVTGVSANLSTSGMFIQTSNPETAGTEFTFRIRIEEWSPIQGKARVVWTRPQSEGPERPAGMGVQFLDLEAQSRRMIRWLVDKNLQEGGKPFDLDTVPAGASKVGAGRRKANGSEPAPSPSTGEAPGGRRWLLVATAVVIVAALAFAGYSWWLGSRSGPRSPQPPQPAEIEPSAVEPSEVSETLAPSSAESEAAVTRLVQTWAAAWESRRPPDLLALYAADFEPESPRTRSQWEAEIERLIDGSEFVRVAVSALEVSISSPDAATASFYRSLRTRSLDDTRRVELELRLTEDGWKIYRERSRG